MFVSSTEYKATECEAGLVNLVFADDATDSVISTANIPASGKYRGSSRMLNTFEGTLMSGEWKLSVVSKSIHPDEYMGSLLHWGLRIEAKPCVAKPRWEKLPSPPAKFTPRRLHTSIAVGNSIFVTGGLSERRLTDLWRFDLDSNTWTELDIAPRKWPLNGQASYLGPFGLLSYGGVAKGGVQNGGQDLRLFDIFDEDWVHLPIHQNNVSVYSDDDEHFK